MCGSHRDIGAVLKNQREHRDKSMSWRVQRTRCKYSSQCSTQCASQTVSLVASQRLDSEAAGEETTTLIGHLRSEEYEDSAALPATTSASTSLTRQNKKAQPTQPSVQLVVSQCSDGEAAGDEAAGLLAVCTEEAKAEASEASVTLLAVTLPSMCVTYQDEKAPLLGHPRREVTKATVMDETTEAARSIESQDSELRGNGTWDDGSTQQQGNQVDETIESATDRHVESSVLSGNSAKLSTVEDAATGSATRLFNDLSRVLHVQFELNAGHKNEQVTRQKKKVESEIPVLFNEGQVLPLLNAQCGDFPETTTENLDWDCRTWIKAGPTTLETLASMRSEPPDRMLIKDASKTDTTEINVSMIARETIAMTAVVIKRNSALMNAAATSTDAVSIVEIDVSRHRRGQDRHSRHRCDIYEFMISTHQYECDKHGRSIDR